MSLIRFRKGSCRYLLDVVITSRTSGVKKINREIVLVRNKNQRFQNLDTTEILKATINRATELFTEAWWQEQALSEMNAQTI